MVPDAPLSIRDYLITFTTTQEHGGKRYRLFFLKEGYDDYCFCFGEPA
jgi:hypothetical protein